MDRRAFISAVTGSLLAAPLAVEAQQTNRTYRIVMAHPAIDATRMTDANPFWKVFFDELRQQGYAEGRNLAVERRSARGLREEEFPEFAADIVRLRPDVVVIYSTRLALAFKKTTTAIPIVAYMADPVGMGVVTNLARPGGNLTGVSSDAGGAEITGKRLELLSEIVQRLSRVAILGGGASLDRQQRSQYEVRGLAIQHFSMSEFKRSEYMAAFAAMSREHAQAVFVEEYPEHAVNVALIGDLAIKAHLPTLCSQPGMANEERRCLVSYAVSGTDLIRRQAAYVAKVLNGRDPGDLPIEQVTKLELVFNLKTAKALGLTIPPLLLQRADQVIE